LNHFAALRRWWIVRWVQEAHFDIEIASGETQHLTELPGANNADTHAATC